MTYFAPGNRHQTASREHIYARYELIRTIVDFVAAVTFIIGSFMFLSDDWERTGTYFFIFGSFCFALSPTLKLVREYRMMKSGNEAELARDFES